MNENVEQVEFDSAQLEAFLDSISNREMQEIEQLRREYEASAQQMRAQARRASLEFHRRIAQQTRTRIESDHVRKVSRARNEFRRQRWQVLLALRERVSARLHSGLVEMWRDPERQMAWCRYWLLAGAGFCQQEKIHMRVGRGGLDVTVGHLENLARQEGLTADFGLDESIPEGAVIRFGSLSIDGLLQTQVENLLEPLDRDLAKWFHDRERPRGDQS